MGKIIDNIRIYNGGNTGIEPMADIVYMSNGYKLESFTIRWDVPDERNEVMKYFNGYTLIKDERLVSIGKQRYVVEGKICYGENLIFVETGSDEKGNSTGTFLNELLENNVKENSKVVIIIDVE